MINYEPALEGGYRRISGFTNDYGEVPGEDSTPVLGLAVFEKLNDGIFACRKPASGNNYFHYWDSVSESWVTPNTSGSPTMVGVNKVRFTKIEWGIPELVFTDGVNPAAIWDGTSYTQITSDLAPSAPKFCENFANHLFLAGDSTKPYNLFFSAPLSTQDFTPASGAGVVNVGFDIKAIKSFRNQLYIFGTSNIKKLVGNNIANFVLEDVTKNLGCVSSDSVVEFNGDLIFLAPDGIRPISGTERIGDVELDTLSKPIQSIFESFTENEDLDSITVLVLNKKSQFRIFFTNSDSLSIVGSLRRGGRGLEYSQLIGVEVYSGDSGYIGSEEYIIHADSNGLVHRQESGQSFNGTPIFSLFQTPYLYMDDPKVRKIFYDLSTYMKSEGEVLIDVGVQFNYGDPEIVVPNDYQFTTEGAAAFFGNATYDTTDIYDGNPSPVRETQIQGSGESVSFSFVTTENQPSHTIQAYLISYALADRR
jgi:hypothetical protein